MILQKKTINNVPTLVPLTADTGSGVPVGTIIGQYKKVNMAGYLYLDGSTFDKTLYPALYAYLGTNVLPDYREFVLVGAEQNSTSATIAAHDVFTQGQEKDDRVQNFGLDSGVTPGQANLIGMGTTSVGSKPLSTFASSGARVGDTTRTKEKAVFWYIKATTGISESEATEMLNSFLDLMDTDKVVSDNYYLAPAEAVSSGGFGYGSISISSLIPSGYKVDKIITEVRSEFTSKADIITMSSYDAVNKIVWFAFRPTLAVTTGDRCYVKITAFLKLE